jgi:phage tail-like protein
MTVDPALPLVSAYRFQVSLLPVGRQTADIAVHGAFQECSGLEVEMDVQEHQEGGRNDGVVRRIGRAKYTNLVLKRGMFQNAPGGPVNGELWSWMQDVVGGVRPARRYDGLVEVMSVGETVVARWAFSRGLPAKLTGPQLDAKTGGVAIEELHIAHEGLRLVTRR